MSKATAVVLTSLLFALLYFVLSMCSGPSDLDAAFECIDAGAVKIPEAEAEQYDDQAWEFVVRGVGRVCAAEYDDGEWLVTVP